MTWLVLALVVLFTVIIYSCYAGIINKRNKVLEALSGIDVQLKKRADLIPNILEIAQKFMDHERSLLMDITKLRTQIASAHPRDIDSLREHLQSAEKLSTRMSEFMVAVENYPALKSDRTMIQAQENYSEVESQIAAARRFYNSSVSELNSSVQIFPGNLIAVMLRISAMPFYERQE